MILAIALSPSLDVTYEVASIQRGEITRPRAVTRVAGGKALNAARAACALGGRVRVVAALGGHVGAWIEELLTAEGVECVPVRLRRTTRTSLAIVEDGDQFSSTDLYEPATTLDTDEWHAFDDACRQQIDRGADWVIVSGSLPGGVGGDGVRALLTYARARGARVAVDCSGEGLREMAAAADVLKINRAEASELAGIRFSSALDAAHEVSERWNLDVIVTDGIAGAAAIIDGIAHTVAPPTVRGRFPAGSGDAFLGGMISALDAGVEPEQALAVGADAAERNATTPGQGRLGPPDDDEAAAPQ